MTSKAESWYLLNSGPGAAAFNMAFDEALLEFVARLGRPVLRFYGWTERAASFGYSQKFADVAGMTCLRPLVRRPTGGGLVPHDADWTYTLAFPPGNGWYALRAPESYRTVHQWIRGAFARLKVETELASGERLISQRDGLVLLAAYGGRLPYELLIAPLEHPDESAFESGLLTPALSILAESLRRLHGIEGPVPLNAWLHDHGHWHFEVLPRLTVFAGIELGAGIYVNSLAPETAAVALRDALI